MKINAEKYNKLFDNQFLLSETADNFNKLNQQQDNFYQKSSEQNKQIQQ